MNTTFKNPLVLSETSPLASLPVDSAIQLLIEQQNKSQKAIQSLQQQLNSFELSRHQFTATSSQNSPPTDSGLDTGDNLGLSNASVLTLKSAALSFYDTLNDDQMSQYDGDTRNKSDSVIVDQQGVISSNDRTTPPSGTVSRQLFDSKLADMLQSCTPLSTGLHSRHGNIQSTSHQLDSRFKTSQRNAISQQDVNKSDKHSKSQAGVSSSALNHHSVCGSQADYLPDHVHPRMENRDIDSSEIDDVWSKFVLHTSYDTAVAEHGPSTVVPIDQLNDITDVCDSEDELMLLLDSIDILGQTLKSELNRAHESECQLLDQITCNERAEELETYNTDLKEEVQSLRLENDKLHQDLAAAQTMNINSKVTIDVLEEQIEDLREKIKDLETVSVKSLSSGCHGPWGDAQIFSTGVELTRLSPIQVKDSPLELKEKDKHSKVSISLIEVGDTLLLSDLNGGDYLSECDTGRLLTKQDELHSTALEDSSLVHQSVDGVQVSVNGNNSMTRMEQLIASATIENEILQSKLNTANKRLSTKVQSIETLLEDAKGENAALKDENEYLKIENESQKLKVNSLELQLKELRSSVASSSADNKKLNAQLSDALRLLENSTKTPLKEVSLFEKENMQLREKIAIANDERNKLRQDLSWYRYNEAQTIDKLHSLEVALESAESARRLAQTECSIIRDNHDYLKKEMEILEKYHKNRQVRGLATPGGGLGQSFSANRQSQGFVPHGDELQLSLGRNRSIQGMVPPSEELHQLPSRNRQTQFVVPPGDGLDQSLSSNRSLERTVPPGGRSDQSPSRQGVVAKHSNGDSDHEHKIAGDSSGRNSSSSSLKRESANCKQHSVADSKEQSVLCLGDLEVTMNNDNLSDTVTEDKLEEPVKVGLVNGLLTSGFSLRSAKTRDVLPSNRKQPGSTSINTGNYLDVGQPLMSSSPAQNGMTDKSGSWLIISPLNSTADSGRAVGKDLLLKRAVSNVHSSRQDKSMSYSENVSDMCQSDDKEEFKHLPSTCTTSKHINGQIDPVSTMTNATLFMSSVKHTPAIYPHRRNASRRFLNLGLTNGQTESNVGLDLGSETGQDMSRGYTRRSPSQNDDKYSYHSHQEKRTNGKDVVSPGKSHQVNSLPNDKLHNKWMNGITQDYRHKSGETSYGSTKYSDDVLQHVDSSKTSFEHPVLPEPPQRARKSSSTTVTSEGSHWSLSEDFLPLQYTDTE